MVISQLQKVILFFFLLWQYEVFLLNIFKLKMGQLKNNQEVILQVLLSIAKIEMMTSKYLVRVDSLRKAKDPRGLTSHLLVGKL